VHSLSRRLLLCVSIPLFLLFGVMGFVLDLSFRELSNRSLQQVLDSQMVQLIAAAELQPNGSYAPASRSLESALSTPGSGLYAQIRSPRVNTVWQSPSTAGESIAFGPALAPGARTFSRATERDDDEVAVESRGIQFSDDPASGQTLTFSVAVSLGPYQKELWRLRSQLLEIFGGLALLLLGTLALLLRWVLSPLRRLEREIHAVEEGRIDTLGSGYPRELSGVATNLNALLVGERKRVSRYRDTLGNLAHSLKTPLSVMRSALTGEVKAAGSPGAALGSEIDRMSGIIEHQLKRAAASGGALLGQAPVDVGAVASELRATLLKVYARKDLSIELAVEPESQFIGDRGDFVELLGNVLDNACKWCKSRVRFTVSTDNYTFRRERLKVVIEDDGPGISEEDRRRVGQRGVRTDENVPGHGIGLAMVQDTIEMYGGSLSIDESPLGGARFSVRLPGR
jgi:two-component system, OmpR family, sensor histidine kinase PhoQ